jgi:lipoyl(octanoyl) transferase
MARWLLLQDLPLDGIQNMERDRELYQNFSKFDFAGVLRFFQWIQPTVSLGRFQSDASLEARCQRLNLPLVRRPTGGQAILHGSDLCWSVISSSQDPLGKDLHTTYQLLSGIVIQALAQLGLNTRFPEKQENYRNQASCFASLTPADLEVAGKKLIGSAQMRNRKVFLQESSLVLKSAPLLADVFPEQAHRAQTSLADWLPEVSVETLIKTLKQSFEQVLEIEFYTPKMVPQERT